MSQTKTNNPLNAPTIVVCYPVTDQDMCQIRNEFQDYDVVFSSQESVSQDILRANVFCGHAKVIPIDWREVVAAGKLKWIQSSAAGLDHCLSSEVVRSDILVSGCSGLFANQVAEQTMALLYALLRRVPLFIDAQNRKEFVRRPTDELHGKTVGIIGFGGNGRRIAEFLHGVAAEILATDIFSEFDVPEFVTAYSPELTAEVFARADVIIVTLPLTSTTRSYVNQDLLSQLKPGSYFINVARGAVVDQTALEAALASGVIGFAGLDVVEPEPLPPTSPLWDMPNVLITPHVGAQSQTRVKLTTDLLCLNHRRYVSGAQLINQVDKSLEFPRPEDRLSVSPLGQITLPKMR